MALDARRITLTQSWLVKAQRDLEAATILQALPAPLLDIAVYHCQQAGEKALKGFLFWHDIPFRKTHNLDELLAQCIVIDATLASLEETANFLTPLATEFRYPSELLEPALDQAREAFERAQVLLNEIVKRLPDEVTPSFVHT